MNTKLAILIPFLVFCSGLIWSGCTSQKLASGQQQISSSFKSGDFEGASLIVDSLKENEIYKAKDRVLYALEMGTIKFFQDDAEGSIENFTNADEYIDQFFAKSASTGIKAFITNDNLLDYNGEVYEDIYINGFKSLAYLQLDKFEDALVEARIIVSKLEQAEQKYSAVAQNYGKADTTETEISWNAGTSNIHDSPLSHYLSAVLYAKSGNDDDARIELQRLKKSIKNHQALPDSRMKFAPAFNKINQPERYNIMLTAFCGQAPVKIDNSIQIEDIDDFPGLKIAIPKLRMRLTKVAQINAVINDTMTVSLPMVEEMDKVARETFKIKKPIIVARATVRGILKSAGEKTLTDAAEGEDGENEEAGEVVGFFAEIIREASEQADLRGWQTMPGKVHINVAKLPPGQHEIAFEYYDKAGMLLHTETRPVTVEKNERLQSATTIYSN
jgi:hypothetical protein